ncbi:hypothetical protein EGW08_002175, partial [Elysia chlorotica]
MYISLSPVLDADEAFHPMSEGLAKKLSVTVREMMAVSQDPDLSNTLIALAGLLPSRAIPMVSQSLMNRLYKHKPASPEGAVALTCSVKALVQWGKASTLVEMLKESLEKALSCNADAEDVGETEGGAQAEKLSKNSKDGQKEQRKKKKTVGFSAAVEEAILPQEVALQALEILLAQPECRPILLARHGEALVSLARSLGTVTKNLRRF